MIDKYGLLYELKVDTNNNEGFTGDAARAAANGNPNMGACDAFVFCSIVRSNNTMSLETHTIDSRDSEDGMPVSELFKIWTIWASKMREDLSLESWQREIADIAFKAFQKRIH